MAQILSRVSGRRDGTNKTVSKSFRDTVQGRTERDSFNATLTDVRVVYDVRTRVSGRQVMQTLNTRRRADAYAATVEAEKLKGDIVDPRLGRGVGHGEHHL